MGCGKSPPPPILWPSLEARLVFGVQLCQHGKKKSPFEGDYIPSNFVAQFLSVLGLCGIVIYIILVVVIVVMVFLG